MFFESFALDLVAKATLVLIGVIVSDSLFVRNASAAIRHRLWSLAFISLLLLPILSLTVPTCRIAVLPNAWERPPEAPPRTSAVISEPRIKSIASLAPTGAPSPPIFDPPIGVEPVPSLPAPLQTERGDHSETPSTASSDLGLAAKPTEWSWSHAVALVWSLGAVLAVLPLVFGMVRNRILQRDAETVTDTSLLRMLQLLREQLGLRSQVHLLQSDRDVVPMTWGAFTSIVMIPSEWRQWPTESRRLVLLHELAHVKRGDVIYQTVARLVCSAFWFHPLVWYALRRLRIERELACDDCVLMAGEVPSDYASELLNIARRYRMPVSPAAVAMAQRSGLEARVRALLDKARSHLPVTPRMARWLLVGSILGATTLAAIRLEATAANGDDDTSSAGHRPTQSSKLTVSGEVIDTSGEPIAGAKVMVVRRFHAYGYRTGTFKRLGTTETNANGRYSMEVPRHSNRYSDGRNFEQRSTLVMASKPGYGLDQSDVAVLGKEKKSLQLGSAKNPIEGRIVDLEGNPLANIHVGVHGIVIPAVSDEDWVDHAGRRPATWLAYPTARDQVLGATDLLGIPPIKTDADGRFEIPPVGDDLRVTLRLDGPGIASTYLQVVTREMPTVNMTHDDPCFHSGKIFGKKFTYAVAPDRVIRGRLTDRTSGQPIPGITVSLKQFSDDLSVVSNFLTTVTDEAGRYELRGVPKSAKGSSGVRLEFIPSKEQPYFRSEKRVPVTEGLGPVDCDATLTKAIWVEGQLTDPDGKPVRGLVAYYPHLDNKNAVGHESFRKGTFGMGDGDGYATDDRG
ncbi:MAG: M56 family metallopeptidase, partial [Planctomycetota bacterium]